ncbi:hypothetical protein EDC01DRAFT_733281 [Geopyxis carbonaria]|nr:hypothetical protein EDC01DRAFT_733281 [Geopyxis carbonaria]
MSSYYGSPPGSNRSSMVSNAPRASSYYPSPIQEQSVYTESRSSYGTISPAETEHTILAPPTPLKTAHTSPSPRSQGGHLHSDHYGHSDAHSPYLPPTSPFGERRPHSPRRYEDKIVANTLSYSDKIIVAPEPVTTRHKQPSPSPLPGIRAMTPLPESFEIALPPGAQLPHEAPEEILFHPNDERPRVGTPRAGTPVGHGRVGTPVDQMLFPVEDRAHTPVQHPYARSPTPQYARSPTPQYARTTTPQSAFRGSPVPTVADSITAYGFSPYRASPVPSQATTMVAPSSYSATPSVPDKPPYPQQPAITSNTYELNGLWNAAQGAHPMNGDGRIYILSTFRQTPFSPDPISFPEHFTFGPALKTPFYTLHAMPSPLASHHTHNELSLRRKNPASGDMQSLARMSLPLSGLPDADGLVTQIYPKRAVVAAMASPALPHTNKTRAAVTLAAERECCTLVYSASRARYELHHPAMSSSNAAEHAPLVVRVEGTVGFDNLGARGSIRLVNTINQDTLAALDFARQLLFVNTGATMKIPSPHIVDVAVATLLAVGTMEGRCARAQRAASPSLRGPGSSVRGASTRGPNSMRGAGIAKVETVGSVREARAARERHMAEGGRKGGCPGPGTVLVKVAKGVWVLVYFTGRLGWEIGKAIVDAFRSVPEDERGRGGGGGGGYEKQYSASTRR